MTFAEQCQAIVAEQHHEVVPKLGDVQYQRGGVLPSEMMLFCCLCLGQGVTRVLESGRSLGYSTELLCQWPDQWRLRSCDLKAGERDDDLLSRYQDSVIVVGDSRVMLPRWLMTLKDENRIAVLIDGPKFGEALQLGERLHEHVAFWAIHDVVPGTSTWRSLWAWSFVTTREEGWRRSWEHLDEVAVKLSGCANWGDMTAESMGLAIVRGGRWRDEGAR
jgi:hypothetical protein